MLWFFLILAAILSLLSLRGETARRRYYGNPPVPTILPPATVIVPVKGRDEGLRENLLSLATLDYPDYELIVTARSEDDLVRDDIPAKARVVLAGDGSQDTGEKINNLLAAVAAARTNSDLLVFADSDGQVQKGWLKSLAGALQQEGVGAATGYRWHLPQDPQTWSMLRSVWNAVIAGGLGPGANNFCWGGAMAIRRADFERLQIAKWWKGAISDDYRLSEAVKQNGLRIAFAPGALVADTGQTTATEFLPWITRQMRITRFYAPNLWRLALFAHIIYCGSMVAGILQASLTAAALAAIPIVIGYYKGYSRLQNARSAMPQHDAWFQHNALIHTLLIPIGTWLWLYACIAAAFTNTIHWRGYHIKLRRLPPPF